MQALRERVGVGDVVEAFGVRVFLRVGIVDAIDLRGLEDGLGADLGGTEGGGRVGGKKRVACAGDENHDTAEFEVASGPADDERLGEVLHFDRGLHADFDAEFFEGGHEGEAIDDGREHAHVVGGGAVHALVAGGEAAPDIPAADDEGEFHAELGGIGDLGSNFLDDFRADALVAAWLAEHLAAEFQDNSFVADLG